MKRNLSIVMVCVMIMFTVGFLSIGEWREAIAFASSAAAWWLNVQVLNKYEIGSDSLDCTTDRRIHHAV